MVSTRAPERERLATILAAEKEKDKLHNKARSRFCLSLVEGGGRVDSSPGPLEQ